MSQRSAETYHAFINFAITHPVWFAVILAVILAAIFGAIFAVIFVAVGIDDAIRDRVRLMKNKRSENSAERLQKRIEELERYRDSLSTDKALYLSAFRIVIVILMLVCVGAMVLLLQQWNPALRADIVAFGMFGIAFVLGIQGLTLVSLDTREKVSKLVGKLNEEIADLKAKLDTKRKVAGSLDKSV